MLYVHGGAYFFGSVDEHRYQIQRHARKLQARVLAPRYRLAPQFPFPCGLLDCLATYLQMLEEQPPETIVLAGDSAGGGMIVSLLVILRDQGLPMPAGAILLSPWVDLTHSFPSVAGDNDFDYVPSHGFWHRPSISWPPPSSTDLRSLGTTSKQGSRIYKMPAIRISPPTDGASETRDGLDAQEKTEADTPSTEASSVPEDLSITIDGRLIELTDQIQMYTHNGLLSHPLVSPILQPSLGGLPPLCVLVGGGEMLRDEQIYLAHKAAAPAQYPPRKAALANQGANAADAVEEWPPTDVQLQVWDDMCHVAPTLSFTRPAKHMYRSVSQFGAWALARAQGREMRVLDDDEISIISSASSDEESSNQYSTEKAVSSKEGPLLRRGTMETQIGKAGDPLPRFVGHMVRQRVTRHGEIYPLAPAAQLPACIMAPDDIGTIKPGPVRKWLATQEEWDRRYAKDKRKVQARRLKELLDGYEPFEGERPPPTALAGRRKRGYVPRLERLKKSRGLAMWSGWGSKHDETTLANEEEKERDTLERKQSDGAVRTTSKDQNAKSEAEGNDGSLAPPRSTGRSRSASRTRMVTDEGQTGSAPASPGIDGTALVAEQSAQRPAIDGQAFPFKLAAPITGERNASTMTLSGQSGIIQPDENAAPEASKETSTSVPQRPEPERFVTASDVLKIT